jgi:hypothetical protein
MEKKRLIFPVIVLVILLTSCAAGRTGIKQAWSFYKINTPGTIAVDDNGNELLPGTDTVREIYMRVKKEKMPVVMAVVINRHCYTPILSAIDSAKVYVGERLPDNHRVELAAKSGNSIWKITVGKHMPGFITNNFRFQPFFYLHVRHKGKNRMQVITTHIELVPELHY